MAREDIKKMDGFSPNQFELDSFDDLYKVIPVNCLTEDARPDTSSLWHDASEIPQANHKNIMYQTNYYSMHNVHIAFIPTCLRSCKITSNGWNEFIKDVNMRRWAYIEDLLPKGGCE